MAGEYATYTGGGQDDSSRVCKDCPTGKYGEGGAAEACVTCPSGEFSDAVVLKTGKCKKWDECKEGTTPTKEPTATSDRQCGACPDEQYKDKEGVHECTALTQCVAGEVESVAPYVDL